MIAIFMDMDKKGIEQDLRDTAKTLDLNAVLSNLQGEECLYLEKEFVDYKALFPQEDLIDA